MIIILSKSRQCAWFLILCGLGFGIGSGCTTPPPVGSSENPFTPGSPEPDKIHWPRGYQPENATFFVHNEIFIEASPDVIWATLIQAESWPEWYSGASRVQVQNGQDGSLFADAVFRWRTMGLDFTSKVREFDPPTRLSWESRKATIKGYHAWLVTPTDHGCRLTTDESQHGFLAFLQGIFIPNKLRRLHDIWLMKIKVEAEKASVEGTNGRSLR